MIETSKNKIICDIYGEIKNTNEAGIAIEKAMDSLFAEANVDSAAQKIFEYVKDSLRKFDVHEFKFVIKTIKSSSLEK